MGCLIKIIESIMLIFTQLQTTVYMLLAIMKSDVFRLRVCIPSGREHCSLWKEIRQVDFQ